MNATDVKLFSEQLLRAAYVRPTINQILTKCSQWVQWQDEGDFRAFQMIMFPVPYFDHPEWFVMYSYIVGDLFFDQPIKPFDDDEDLMRLWNHYNYQALYVEARRPCVLSVNEINTMILQLDLLNIPSMVYDVVILYTARHLYLTRLQ